MEPNTDTGTLTQNTARQSIAASSPPTTRPRNCPASAVIWLTPRAIPRCVVGNASVRIAAELDVPPRAQPDRAGLGGERVERQRQGRGGEDQEAQVVHAHPAEHVAEPA